MLLDSHCHVNELVYGSLDNVDQIIHRAKEAGVIKMITIGSGYGLEASSNAVEVANRHPNVFATVGVHPYDADKWNQETRELLIQLSKEKKVVAVGEMGLDYHYEGNQTDQQRRVFIEQIRLAKESHLPVVVHDRDSKGEACQILSDQQAFDTGVLFHCYCGTVMEMRQIIKKGGYISIPGIVTFSNADKMRAVVKAIPLERLLVETDSPFLTPVPLRGKINEPANLIYVIDKIAQLRGVSSTLIAKETYRNACLFFGI
jgi:TatD DNase family protein